MKSLAAGIGLLLSSVPLAASALDLRVGTGAGCTHATLQAALTAIQGVGGDHTIRINAGTYAVADGMVYQPTVAQGLVTLEGGYASCTATAPSGSPTTDAGRSIFDGSGGLARSVLELQINGWVGSFQLRRIALQGGDAFNTQQRYNAGGGLAVYGQASVLIGSGVSIRNNGAGYGGGVALVGSRVQVNEPVRTVDFYIQEGAEIRNNDAAAVGGGIHCGGATTLLGDPPMQLRHGRVVHRHGSISNNEARAGSAIWCVGSYAEGGYQPRPGPGEVALIANNIDRNAAGPESAVHVSLDLGVAPTDGVRVLGAIGGSNNGLVLFFGNQSQNGAVVTFWGWWDRDGASPAPPTPPAFRLQNVLVIGNRGTDTRRGILAAGFGLDLRLSPAAPELRCGLTPPLGACVLFEDNELLGPFDPNWAAPLISAEDRLRIDGARIRGNVAHRALVEARPGGDVTLAASILDGNAIGGTEPVLFGAREVLSAPGRIQVVHSTVTDNAADRYFRIDGSGSTALIQGTVLHHPVAPRALRFGSAPPGNLTIRWCNYLGTTSDPGFTGATQVADPFGPLVTVTGTLGFDASFSPPLALIDKCAAAIPPATPAMLAVTRDHYGTAFGVPVAPVNPNRLYDLGAVEFRPEVLLSDGFEAP
jgi:hypothetical protein